MKGLKTFLTTSAVAGFIAVGALVVTTVGASAHTVCNSNGECWQTEPALQDLSVHTGNFISTPTAGAGVIIAIASINGATSRATTVATMTTARGTVSTRAIAEPKQRSGGAAARFPVSRRTRSQGEMR